jgi:hypothetical protein
LKTIHGESLEIQPGERAILLVPIPVGTLIEKIEVDPPTAARFKVIRADYMGPSEAFGAAGIRSPAARIELENISGVAQSARVFVNVERPMATVSRELGGIAERYNRFADAVRRRFGLN